MILRVFVGWVDFTSLLRTLRGRCTSRSFAFVVVVLLNSQRISCEHHIHQDLDAFVRRVEHAFLRKSRCLKWSFLVETPSGWPTRLRKDSNLFQKCTENLRLHRYHNHIVSLLCAWTCPGWNPDQPMLRRHSIHPQEAEASFTFLSDTGDLSYLPTGHITDPLHFARSVDDSRLARSTVVSTNYKRSPSVPAVASLEEPDTPKKLSSRTSDGHSDEARLGLPERWMIYPVSRHGGHASYAPKQGSDDIDFAKFDFTRSIEFSLSADASASTESLPAYRSRTNSAGQLEDTLPPYCVDDELSSVVQAIYAQNSELLKKPKLKRARLLPRDFTEHELKEIRRKTRHRIRVVTRNSLGLTVNLGLSSVAPQMLIAAAINGFCLGIGAYKLYQHLRFLA